MRAWSARLSFRARVLLIVTGTFVLLVALRLHGSSIALSARLWAPESAMNHFMASPLLDSLRPKAQQRWRPRLMAEPRYIRIDEWANEGTLYSLMQLTHDPPFPVVNRNVGDGQNMLLLPWAPVLHLSSLARPMTWGYFFAGPASGLAWAWWSQVAICVIGMFLLLELLVPASPWLALLGAGWFSGSAYVAFWSLWPAYTTGLGALAFVCGYRLLTSPRRAAAMAWGAGLGLSFAAFCLQLYPPWLVPLGLVFLGLFAALGWRERLWLLWRGQVLVRLSALALGVLIAGALVGSFVVDSVEGMRAMASSDYPGLRRAAGGDCPAWRLFGGLYNGFIKDFFPRGSNPSEAAGFFLLFPAVPVAAIVSPRVRARLGAVGWVLIVLACSLTYYAVAPIPKWLATLTLLAHSPGYRAQIGLGFVSIVLTVYALSLTRDLPFDRESRLAALAGLLASLALYLWQGVELEQALHYFEQSKRHAWLWIGMVSLLAALAATLAVIGRARTFSALLAAALIVTSYDFNPVSIGLPDWRTSELCRAIQATAARDVAGGDAAGGGERPLWLAYGGPDYPNIGSIVQLCGQRSLGGVYYYPQVELWRRFDPRGSERKKYNRFAVARLDMRPLGTRKVEFKLQAFNVLRVAIAPDHRELARMGARYVLTLGDDQGLGAPPLTLIYRSEQQNFAIWQLPASRGVR